jgi:lactate racemase
MRVTMSLGRNGLPVELDDAWDVTVIAKPSMPVIDDPSAALRRALECPVGSPPLLELARKARQVCLLICDITRPVPNGVILPVLLRQLLQAGLTADRIRLLVATGLHRPNEGDELREVVGDDWVQRTFRIDNHVARNDHDHIDIGQTAQGIPVLLDRRLVEADLRIAIGLVEPHFMAGYSGGRKLIAPGVASHRTIRRLHGAAVLEHPHTANCRLDGNPLHDQQLQILRLLGGAYAINTVIDDQRRVAMVNFGEITASHLAAVEFVRRYAEVTVPRRFPTVITSAAGYPLDRTYYQTVKGMVAALGALEDGGNLIVVSDCSEGLGSSEFIAAQRQLLTAGPTAFCDSLLRKPLAEIDEWQTEMLVKALRRARIFLWAPGLSAEQTQLTGVEPIRSLPETIRQCVKQSRLPAVAIIPEGPYVVPAVTVQP